MSADDTEVERLYSDLSGGLAAPSRMLLVGARLAAAREAAGLARADVAATTRIPERHLAALERDDAAALPGRTYAIGFARTYARAVGLDPEEIARALRAELDGRDASTDGASTATFSPGDPARVPSAGLAWIAGAAVAVVALVAALFWRSYAQPGQLPSLLPQPAAAPARSAPSAPPAPIPTVLAGGAVTFTATQPGIWVKFYDAAGKQLLQKQLAQGESYTVPADAAGPRIWTGRPEALTITIGGHPVPPLATDQRTIKDMPVSATALMARGVAVASPAAMPSVLPGPTPTQSAAPGAAAADRSHPITASTASSHMLHRAPQRHSTSQSGPLHPLSPPGPDATSSPASVADKPVTSASSAPVAPASGNPQ